MCGICGILNKNSIPINQSILQKMNEVLYHRGPDDKGYFVDGSVGLGMRRLSIIDLDGGYQPIHNEDKSVWVILNGEIYNYQELSGNLKSKGHKFYTKSDTEVIVHLYEDYGEECVHHLRGMFAFALWDRKAKKLILARDRTGIKPLFYYEDSQCLVFGSEIKSIRQHNRPSNEIDFSALDSFLTLLYIPSPKTIYQDIYKLPPGHLLIVDNNEKRLKQYWELEYRIDYQKSMDDFAEAILEKFREVVKIHMISDVPLGTLLSGGIDSSALVAVMSEISNKPVETFNICYDGKVGQFDESKHARFVADTFETNHHELRIKPDVFNDINEICSYFDEPFADSSAIPNYYISQLAKQYVTVALCGLGGDEIAAGYDRYVGLLLSRQYQKIPRLVREKLAVYLASQLPDSKKGRRFSNLIKRFVNSGMLPIDKRYFSYISYLAESQKQQLYSPQLLANINGEHEKQFDTYFSRYTDLHTLNRALFADLKMYLPDDLLTLSDRMSMAHSLELRVPFLDHELVEIMATVPPKFKLHRMSKKYILKKSFQKILPKEVLYRKKWGFSIPLVLWFRKDLKSFVQQTLSPDKIRKQGFFNYSKIAEMLEAHFQAKENYHSQIWALVVFSLWYDSHVENSVS